MSPDVQLQQLVPILARIMHNSWPGMQDADPRSMKIGEDRRRKTKSSSSSCARAGVSARARSALLRKRNFITQEELNRLRSCGFVATYFRLRPVLKFAGGCALQSCISSPQKILRSLWFAEFLLAAVLPFSKKAPATDACEESPRLG